MTFDVPIVALRLVPNASDILIAQLKQDKIVANKMLEII